MELSKKLGTMSDEEKLDLLATDGMLVKRPILITETAVLVGFKESDWEQEVGTGSVVTKLTIPIFLL